MNILVPVDGSPYTKRTLAYLAAHDEWLGAQHQYTLLHVPAMMPPRVAAFTPSEDIAAHYEATAERVFKTLRTYCKRHALDARFVSKAGEPADVIAKTATAGRFGLVMMGSHGHGELLNLVLGSVATKVLAKCKVPVLLVR
jgi:nucleotide-binding universal stress UspA family protein